MSLKRLIHNLPLQKKLILLVGVTTGAALLVFTLLSVYMQMRVLRTSMLENLGILTTSIAAVSTAGLSFADKRESEEILSTLEADPDIEMAGIYDSANHLFCSYSNSGYHEDEVIPQSVGEEENRFVVRDNRLKVEIFTPVMLDDKRIGTLYVLANTDRLTRHFRNIAYLLGCSMVVILIIAGAVSGYLQRLITVPLFKLTGSARDITRNRDYSIRVEKSGNDELGQFIDDFNIMVQAVQDRDEELQEYQHNLEKLVRERTEELKIKRDEALAAANAKSEFLANMSHEIRTPMNGVIGVLSLLKDANLSDEHRRLLATANRSADSLLLIFNDILDFSKIDAGMITFESIGFELQPLVEETCRLYLDSANVKGLELSCFVAPEVPWRVNGDPTRLRQVLTNLLSNAIKFTDVGEVYLAVHSTHGDDFSGEVAFEVSDTGIGIPVERQNIIFEKFAQVDGSTEREYGGTGLGLSVCKELVEMQGGSIAVDSTPDKGSLFRFTLPLTVEEQVNPNFKGDSLSGRYYLVIGTTRTCREILPAYLRGVGAEVEVFTEGGRAVSVMQERLALGKRVDGVLVSHHAAKFDGIRLVHELNLSTGGASPKTYLVSSLTVPRRKILETGLEAVLLRPVSSRELYGHLGIETSALNGPLKIPGREEGGALKYENTLSGKVLIVDDEPINQKVLMAIMNKFGLDAEVAGSGKEALCMITERGYSLILMDIQMPGMSGIDVAEQIRATEVEKQLPRVPIVAITANALSSIRDKCLYAGMDDYVTKPVKPEVLFDKLIPWLLLRKTTTHKDVIVREERDAAERPATLIWNRNRALELVGHDSSLLHDLIVLYLERYSLLLERVEQSIREQDGSQLCQAAHAYKGAVTHFAAEESCKLAYDLEKMGQAGETAGAMVIMKELRKSTERLAVELREYIR